MYLINCSFNKRGSENCIPQIVRQLLNIFYYLADNN